MPSLPCGSLRVQQGRPQSELGKRIFENKRIKFLHPDFCISCQLYDFQGFLYIFALFWWNTIFWGMADSFRDTYSGGCRRHWWRWEDALQLIWETDFPLHFERAAVPHHADSDHLWSSSLLPLLWVVSSPWILIKEHLIFSLELALCSFVEAYWNSVECGSRGQDGMMGAGSEHRHHSGHRSVIQTIKNNDRRINRHSKDKIKRFFCFFHKWNCCKCNCWQDVVNAVPQTMCILVQGAGMFPSTYTVMWAFLIMKQNWRDYYVYDYRKSLKAFWLITKFI